LMASPRAELVFNKLLIARYAISVRNSVERLVINPIGQNRHGILRALTRASQDKKRLGLLAVAGTALLERWR
jgi:hypothetical protein